MPSRVRTRCFACAAAGLVVAASIGLRAQQSDGPARSNDARLQWVFQAPVEPAVPAVSSQDWPQNAIDRFILAKLDSLGLTPSPDTDRRTLIRRATFDLIGLPPTPQEIDAFLMDESPDAFAKVVDRLLESPHYGERWGRHWLDVVRYADTAGDNSDYPVPQLYKYRNWVIDAFNRDMPYDEFVRQQLAGDLLPSDCDQERYAKIVATGYVAITRRFGSVVDDYPQHLTIEDTIDNLGRTFLGLTINCARCHDHKFDPITAEDQRIHLHPVTRPMTDSKRRKWSRRQAVRSMVGGSMMLPGILSELLTADETRPSPSDPLLAKSPHFAPRAKRMILLFSTGGVAHMETLDYKPELFKADGKTTGAGGGLSRERKPLLKPAWEFRPGGQCGTMVSDLFPHLRECMDDVCLIRSMKSDDNEHFQATLAIHTGSFFFARPSLGSWVSYGLGTFNQNLPSFIVIAPHLPYAGTQVFSNDFLPAYHQGTRVIPGAEPIPNLRPRTTLAGIQEMELGLGEAFNREHLLRSHNDSELAARIRSFETAYRMQAEAPEAFDLAQETDETLQLYGMERGKYDGFGWQCLVARRLAERGVRFIELIDTGSASNWDAHSDTAQMVPLAKNIDRPIAALIKDLKRRGLLDETLVVWTTEFGRTPGIDGPKGRGHHGACFSSWLAGGGTHGGTVYGETDEIGATVASDEVHVHDLHATILHLLGLDHTRLVYRHAGRDFRLTDVAGNVVHPLFA